MTKSSIAAIFRIKTLPEFTKEEAQRFWAKVKIKDSNEECWPWIGCTSRDGYGRLIVRQRFYRAPRIAFCLHYGRSPIGFCLHDCDNPICCNPHHLQDGTQQDNIDGMVARKRCWKNGNVHHSAKLAESQVREIYAFFAKENNLKVIDRLTILAERFHVGTGTINKIVYARRWKHLGLKSLKTRDIT